MGMFDYIRCEALLPDGWRPRKPLQTKDFDCEMVTHVITKEGRLLICKIIDSEVVPESERPYPGADGVLKWAGSIRIKTTMEDSNFHGVVRLYGLEDGDPDRWHEYRAKFTDGQLVSIEVVTGEDKR